MVRSARAHKDICTTQSDSKGNSTTIVPAIKCARGRPGASVLSRKGPLTTPGHSGLGCHLGGNPFTGHRMASGGLGPVAIDTRQSKQAVSKGACFR